MAKVTFEGIAKPLWKGMVKIDSSLDDYVSDISYIGKTKQLHIKDVKYHHVYYDTLDNPRGALDYPSEIMLLVKGKELQKYMKCSAVLAYRQVQKTRGLIRKEKYYEEILSAKGFALEPASHIRTNLPCMASYRANIGGDNAFNIEKQGIVSFYTASASRRLGFNAARKSITCVFIASDQLPFVAYVRKKGKMFKMICSSDGMKEELEDKGGECKGQKIKPIHDPLLLLKLRLATDEITKEEYKELKKMLVS
ncbi:MAG: hypothetical protein ACE5J2_01830 [Nitrososphaerales archaeon]